MSTTSLRGAAADLSMLWDFLPVKRVLAGLVPWFVCPIVNVQFWYLMPSTVSVEKSNSSDSCGVGIKGDCLVGFSVHVYSAPHGTHHP